MSHSVGFSRPADCRAWVGVRRWFRSGSLDLEHLHCGPGMKWNDDAVLIAPVCGMDGGFLGLQSKASSARSGLTSLQNEELNEICPGVPPTSGQSLAQGILFLVTSQHRRRSHRQ